MTDLTIPRTDWGDPGLDREWQDFFLGLIRAIDDLDPVSGDYVEKSGSITQITTRPHADLQALGEDDHPQYLKIADVGLSLPDVSVTISGGVITCNEGSANYIVDTEGGAATDDLDQVVGLAPGDLYTLQAASAARVVTVKHDGVNMRLNIGQKFVLNSTADIILMRYVSSGVSHEISRSSNV